MTRPRFRSPLHALLPLALGLLPQTSCGGAADPLPGPQRARAAAERVTPALKRDLTAKGLRFGDPVFLRAFKEEDELELWVLNQADGKFHLFRTYRIAAQSGKPGPKQKEGDRQVPEGFYHVSKSAMKPDSAYHLAFNIGYPNALDQELGRTGNFIMIHGNSVSIGCLAMTDEKIEEIYTLCDAALQGGQSFFRVHIFPFRLTGAALKKRQDDPWHAFWTNLKEGHDWFESKRLPPDATAHKGAYRFR